MLDYLPSPINFVENRKYFLNRWLDTWIQISTDEDTERNCSYRHKTEVYNFVFRTAQHLKYIILFSMLLHICSTLPFIIGQIIVQFPLNIGKLDCQTKYPFYIQLIKHRGNIIIIKKIWVCNSFIEKLYNGPPQLL